MNEHRHLASSDVRRLWLARPRRAAPSRRRRRAASVQAVTLEMLYAVDDLVVPTDLPRAFVCRVLHAHHVEGTVLQVLELAPLEGPWPAGTALVRGSDSVRPATSGELWAVRTAPAALALAWPLPVPSHAPPLVRRRARRPAGVHPKGAV